MQVISLQEQINEELTEKIRQNEIKKIKKVNKKASENIEKKNTKVTDINMYFYKTRNY